MCFIVYISYLNALQNFVLKTLGGPRPYYCRNFIQHLIHRKHVVVTGMSSFIASQHRNVIQPHKYIVTETFPTFHCKYRAITEMTFNPSTVRLCRCRSIDGYLHLFPCPIPVRHSSVKPHGAPPSSGSSLHRCWMRMRGGELYHTYSTVAPQLNGEKGRVLVQPLCRC